MQQWVYVSPTEAHAKWASRRRVMWWAMSIVEATLNQAERPQRSLNCWGGVLYTALCPPRGHSVMAVLPLVVFLYWVVKSEHHCGLRRQSSAPVKNTTYGARRSGFVSHLALQTRSVTLRKSLPLPAPHSPHLKNGSDSIHLLGLPERLWGKSLLTAPLVNGSYFYFCANLSGSWEDQTRTVCKL